MAIGQMWIIFVIENKQTSNKNCITFSKPKQMRKILDEAKRKKLQKNYSAGHKDFRIQNATFYSATEQWNDRFCIWTGFDVIF